LNFRNEVRIWKKNEFNIPTGRLVNIAVLLQVTVFGSGSGATSISMLLASTSSRHLFSRAWLSNPSPKPPHSLAEAELQNDAFYK